jgi:hypothetical protein
VVSATIDFFFYYYRVYKPGYLQLSLLTGLAETWLLMLLLAILGRWPFTQLMNGPALANLFVTRLSINSSLFNYFFFLYK